MPYFSIVIPTYNRAHMLCEVVGSLIRQTFTDWECIIVDDGSTDNTKHVVDELMAKDQRIRYVYQQNAERSAARNNGARNALGKYFIFLDSDDYFEPNHFDNLLQFIKEKNEPIAMFFTGVKRNENGVVTEAEFKLPTPLPLDFFLFNAVVPARVCLHCNIFQTLEFDLDSIIVEDTVLWTEVLQEFPVHYLPISSVVYRWHGGNSVNLQKHNAFKLRLRGLKKLFTQKLAGKKINLKSKRLLLSQCYMGIAKHHRLNSRFLKAFWFVLVGFFLYPEIQTKEKMFLLSLGLFRNS